LELTFNKFGNAFDVYIQITFNGIQYRTPIQKKIVDKAEWRFLSEFQFLLTKSCLEQPIQMIVFQKSVIGKKK